MKLDQRVIVEETTNILNAHPSYEEVFKGLNYISFEPKAKSSLKVKIIFQGNFKLEVDLATVTLANEVKEHTTMAFMGVSFEGKIVSLENWICKDLIKQEELNRRQVSECQFYRFLQVVYDHYVAQDWKPLLRHSNFRTFRW
jgi:hypothetical protein